MSIRQGNNIIAGTPDASSVKIDNITLTENQAGDTQAVALVDRNTGYVKTWTGTQAEYDAIMVKDPNTLYNVEDDETSHDSSIGLDIGDIGFAPLGIDETQNKRRYLNGQVISQAQFVSFTAKVKNAILFYPSLGATEENWQAEVTNSKLGQCGKFVIDDEAKTIRLPKVVNINGLTDLSLFGGIKAESLPNIKGSATAAYWLEPATGTMTGAFASDGTTDGKTPNQAGTSTGSRGFTFNASRSSSTYQDNAPVQQEAVQYPYFIQVATGVEESVDVTREIELNNPFSLLDYKWSEYELNNASWLLSNGAFHSGTVYKAVYELLLKIKNGTETKGGVSVKMSTEAYTDTDFVLNTANTTFRLPVKVKQKFYNAISGNYPVVGNGMTLGLTSGSQSGGMIARSHYANQELFQTDVYGDPYGTISKSNGQFTDDGKSIGVTKDASKSGLVAKLSSTEVSGLKLYFYVGETIQDANVINASGVLTRVADLSDNYISGLGMPSNKSIDLTLGASGSSYTAPANGYFSYAGSINTSARIHIDTPYLRDSRYTVSGQWNCAFLPVKKGVKMTLYYEGTASFSVFKFIYAEGDK